jgi:pilus assembly protein CpaC
LIHRNGRQATWVIHVFRRSPQIVQQEVTQLLQSSPTLRARRVGRRLFIEGAAADEREVARAERIAALFPGQVESLVVRGAPPTERKLNIRIDFFFVQYDRSSGAAFGLDWPGRFGGEPVHTEITHDYLRGTTTTATASVIDHPLPALDLGSYEGWAKVLKQSTVITANGSEATFESGGEQNFAVQAAQTAAIQQIEFGTRVAVLPRLDASTGDLEIRVSADVAHLVPPAPGTGLPGRATSKLETTVRMKLGQSLILSGIRASSRRVATSGLPLLSELPLLGLLFGTRQATDEQVESALFVIPAAVESVPRPAQELVESALQQYQRYSGDLDEVSSYPKQVPIWKEPK